MCVGILETSRSRVSENAQLEKRVGILERRDPELRGHESIENAQQKPVNESVEFESERVGWDRIDTVTITYYHYSSLSHYSLLLTTLLTTTIFCDTRLFSFL